MSKSTKFHFKVVGDDYISKKDSLVKRYASGKDLEVNGIIVNVKLSLYTDATVETVTSELEQSTVDGYIFVYNVSELESFKRLNMWMTQIDTYCLQAESIVQEPKVLIGNITKDEERAVELRKALEYAQSTNMAYFEAKVEEDELEVERAIVTLVKEKLPPSLLVPPGSRKIFGRKRTVTVATAQEAEKNLVSPNFRRSSSPTPEKSIELLQSLELSSLMTVMMSLNMSVAKLSFSLHKEGMNDGFVMVDTRQRADTTTTSSPLARVIKVAIEADKCVKAAQGKFDTIKGARDETLLALKCQLEEKHLQIDDLRRENHKLAAEKISLEQQLEQANTRNTKSQTLIDKLKQDVQSSGGDLNHWKIEATEVEVTSKPLGTGGYANVSVAEFRGLEVAAKRLHGIILNSYNRGLFEREMNIAARIRHPNLVQFMGAVIDKEPIILMELMSTTLRDVIPKEQNKLTQEQIPPICRDVTRALTYLHAMKPEPIIHRDVSSANILLEPAANSLWRAKVSDYGSANFLSKLNTKAPGNAVYAAPEAQSPQQQSPKMDVFSFGVLVMEMYLREFPDPNNRDQMVYEVEILYPDIVSIIKNCLRHNPKDRLRMYDVLQRLSHS